MSTATASELFAVLTRMVTPGGWGAVTRLLELLDIEMVPYDELQMSAFRRAYQTYGRGGHNTSKARLHLGDCFAYALAATLAEPLLHVGDDFTHTDLMPARPGPISRQP